LFRQRSSLCPRNQNRTRRFVLIKPEQQIGEAQNGSGWPVAITSNGTDKYENWK
jgi:hypothetical protein